MDKIKKQIEICIAKESLNFLLHLVAAKVFFNYVITKGLELKTGTLATKKHIKRTNSPQESCRSKCYSRQST